MTTSTRTPECETLDEDARATRSTRNLLVEQHMDLAEHIARDYAHRGIEAEDLRQVAMVGLVNAADRYDPDRGSRFTAFASATINGEIKRYFRDHGWAVRPPRSLQESNLRVRRASDTLMQELGQPPTVSQLAERTGLTEDAVLAALAAGSSYRADRIDPGPDERPGSMERQIAAPDAGYRDADDRLVVVRMMETVAPRERRILKLRFWGDKTQSEIANEVGISQMHVSRLLRRAVKSMRRAARAGGRREETARAAGR